MPSSRNLVLTGFMGTGKTTVGKELAARLGMGFVDTDELIEAKHGPIARIFAERGEEGFREIERAVAEEVSAMTGMVIATGGRMALDAESAHSLSRNGLIVCLVATPETIHGRIAADDSRRERPLLQAEDVRQRIDQLVEEREERYRRFPQVPTDGATPGEVVDQIIRLWNEDDSRG
jgi:shikimate kinase